VVDAIRHPAARPALAACAAPRFIRGMTTADSSLPPLDLHAPTLDPLALAAELMAARSTSGAEGPAIDRMEAVLRARGWRVTRIPVTPGRDDLFAEGELPAEVTFSTHLDTVPPYIAPRIAGDRLLGRGACDAKGIAAAMVCAAEQLRARGVPVGLLFVVGEETAHDGAHAADAAQPRIAPRNRVLINGEPTESLLGTGTKGALRFTLRTAGRACHSAYPELGRSAIQSLARLVVELESLPLPSDPVLGATTINVGSVSGGVADNVVPPSAEARLMARLVGPQHELETVLDAWVAGRATVTYGITVPAVRLGTVPGFRTGVVAFATDIPALGAWGTPYLYGPGSIHVAHTDDEYIEIAELREAVDAYVRLASAAVGA
jgi:acetylornithine deacetylase